MTRLAVFAWVVFFMTLELGAVNVTIDLCFQDGVRWTVTEGTVGGATYIETTDNLECVHNVTNAVSQTFVTNYTFCDSTIAITGGGTVHQFIIVVQEISTFNAFTDTRWTVTCNFNVGATNVESIFISQSNNPAGNPGNDITADIEPNPVLNLYTTDSDGNQTSVISSTVLTLGTNVTAKITLNQNTTDYNMQVILAEMSSQRVGDIAVQSTVTLIDGTTYCAVFTVFISFEYLTDPFGVSYAETQFQVFLPTAPSISLQSSNVQLKLLFRVDLCLKVGSGCVQQSCSDRPSSRRKRQVDADTTTAATTNGQNTTTFNLNGGFQVRIDPDVDQLTDNNGPVVEIGTNLDDTVCLDKTTFWGLIMGLIGFLVAACIASCALCYFFLRCRRRKGEKKKLSETSSSTTISAYTVDRKLSGEPLSQQNFVLPRFVPLSGSRKSE